MTQTFKCYISAGINNKQKDKMAQCMRCGSVWASSEGSYKHGHLHSLARAFAARTHKVGAQSKAYEIAVNVTLPHLLITAH